MNYFKSRVKTVVPALTLLMTVVALSWYPVSRAQQSAVSPGTGDATFKPPVSYTAGTQPASIATGDFNSDGKPDLAEVNQVTNDVRVFSGNGAGASADGSNLFQAPALYAVGANPRAIVAGDFNRDHKLDLAVANFNDGTVSVLLNNGDGTFQPKVDYPAGNHPRSMVAMPFPFAGNSLALVMTNADDGKVSVLTGNSNGTFNTIFGTAPSYAAGTRPIGLATGDFDGDGRLDVVVADRDGNSANVLLNNGGGGFRAPLTFATGNPGAFWVATDDFNGDGKLDLAVAHVFPDGSNNSKLSVLLSSGTDSSGNPTFQSPVLYTIGTNTTPQSVAGGDFNGDGKPDLVVANFGGNVTVFVGNGDGTFQPAVNYAAGTNPGFVAIGDLNQDGALDLAVANDGSSSTTISVLLGNTIAAAARANGKIIFQNGPPFSLSDPTLGTLYFVTPGAAATEFGGGNQPNFSLDGSKIAFVNSDPGGHLAITSVSSYSPQILVRPQGGSQLFGLNPKWSPDGTQVAYQGNVSVNSTTVQKIFIINAACTSGNAFDTSVCNSTTLDFGANAMTQNIDPAWRPYLSHSGGARMGRIVYVRTADPNAVDGDIFATELTIATNGVVTEGTTNNLTQSAGNYSFPAYTPDGNYIAFTRDSGLWMMGADGSNPHQIMHTIGAQTNPLSGDRVTWSPDGSKIAFDFSSLIWTADIAIAGDGSATASNIVNVTSSADVDAFASWGTSTAAPTPTPSPTPAGLTLSFDGRLRDRVSRSETGISGDGDSDGTFTVTLPPGSANKVITKLDLVGENGNRWDTAPNNGLWVVGISDALDSPLLNNADGSVSFQAGNPGVFKLFVPDSNPSSFLQAKTFTLTVTFSDTTTATAGTAVSQEPTWDMGISMSGPTSVKVGDTYRYSVSLKNFGTALATGVQFTDSLPANLQLSDLEPHSLCDQSNIHQTGATARCSIDQLQAGAASTILVTVKAVSQGSSVNNTASVAARVFEPDPDPHPNSVTVQTNLVQPTDLAVTMDGPAQVNSTDNITYTIAVTNKSNQDAFGVTLTNPIPANAIFVSTASGPLGCSQTSDGNFTCNLGTVQQGVTLRADLVLKSRSNTGGAIVNTASVASTNPEANLLNNEATKSTAVKIGSDVSVTMTAPTQVSNGDDLTYTIRITNNGPSTASQVLVGDQVPLNTSFVSVIPGPQTNFPKCDRNLFPKDPGDQDAVQCLLGAMPSGTTFQVNLTVHPNESGKITNSVVAFASFPDVADANPTNNNVTVSTITCVPGNSAVPAFTTSSPDLAAVGQPYVYNARAQDARGSHVTYTLAQSPAGMTIDSNNGMVNWTPPAQFQGQTVPLSIIASNGSCNGTVTQSFSLTVTEAPPPGGFKLCAGQVCLSSNSIVRIGGNNAAKTPRTNSPQDFPNGTYKLGGNTKINDYLYFDGMVTVTINRTAATMDVSVSQGRLYVTRIPFYGDFTLWQGGGLNFSVDGNGEVTKFLQTNVQNPLRVANVDVTIEHATLLLTGDLGIKLQGHLNFPQVPGIKGLSASFQALFITQSGVRFTGDINVPNFDIGGFGVHDVHMQWIANDNPLLDVFKGSGTLITPAFQVAGSVEFIGGNLNSVSAFVGISGPGLPVPPFFNMTGAGIGVQNIHTGPFTIFIEADVTIANPAVANIIKLSRAKITYTAPNQLDISSDLDILTARAANATISAVVPYSLSVKGRVTLVDSFPVFLAQAALAAGAKDDGTGHFTFFIAGSAAATVQIPDGDSWFHKLLKANPGPDMHFPVIVAHSEVAFGFPPGSFSFNTSVPVIGTVTTSVKRLEGSILAEVATNYGNLPITIPTTPTRESKAAAKNGGAHGSSTTSGAYIERVSTATPLALGSVAVAANAPKLVFELYAGAGAARYDLIRPDSTRITPDNAAANDAVFVQNNDASESFYVIDNPAAGTWSIEAEDGSQGPFLLNGIGADAPPVMNSVQAAQTGASVQINYDATDADDAAPVSLYYDQNQSGFHGQLIASELPNSSNGSYIWHTGDGTPSGDYYVYAVIDDGKNQPERKYAATKVTVVDSQAPVTPQDVVVNPTNENSLIVSWSANTESNLHGYQVRYAVDNGAGTVLDQLFDAGNQTSVRLPSLENNTTYLVSVIAYSQTQGPDPNDSTRTITNNHMSTPSTPQTATTGIAMPPMVQVTSPNGGEQIFANTDLTISWSVDQGDDLLNQQVEISTDSGATYAPLQISLDRQARNFLWHVPAAVQSTTARIRITAVDKSGNTGVDVSDADFLLNSPAPTPLPTPAATAQFSAASYGVSEGGGSASITVTRSGNTSGASTIEFATSDGTAKQRVDYITNAGTLSFAAGETSKTLIVLVIDNGYVDGDRTLNINLSNPSGASLANPTTTLTIQDNDTVPASGNPLDNPAFFVRQHYLDFLGREPDQGGWDYWTSQITDCNPSDALCIHNRRVGVSNAFFYELEFQQTGSYVYRLYRAAYGNNQPFSNPDSSNQSEAKKLPGYDVFEADRAQVVGGVSLPQSQLALATDFAYRPEFVTVYPVTLSGPDFVDAVLATIKNDVGVDLTSQRDALINEFNAGGRSQVMYRLADDNASTNPINNREFIDAEYNRAFVAMQYFGYLRRDVDIAGFLFWLGQVSSAPLRDEPKQHAMVCSFITSDEYQQRFSSVVTHTNLECPQ